MDERDQADAKTPVVAEAIPAGPPTIESLTNALNLAEQRSQALSDQLADLRGALSLLSEERRWYVDMYDRAPAGYLTLDQAGVVQSANLTSGLLLGLDLDLLRGQPLTNRIQPEDLQVFFDHRQQLLESRQPQRCELRLIRGNGESFWARLEASMAETPEDGEGLCRAVLTDISEQRRAEQALRESEERYRTVSRLTSEYIFRVDLSASGQISLNMVSDRFTGATGRSLDETRTPEHWRNIVHPDDATRFFAHLQRLIAEGGRTEYEGRFFVKGGQLRWVHVFAEAIWDPVEKRTTSIVGAVADISERKRVEAERQALQDQLMAVNQKLAEALRLKDEFLSSMSHELRTPLHAILGFTQMLKEQVYGPVNERLARGAAVADDAGRHLLALINDILDLSKIQAGRLVLEEGVVPVRALCEASLQMVEKAAAKKSVALHLDQSPDITVLVADGRRLKQMLVNLLSNAVKFTPEGGAVDLSVRGNREAGVIQFAVTDTGIGIAEDQLSRLFQPFSQIDSRLSRQHSGTGLGLSLVLNMAALHGGGVEVESRPGEGSCFTISLPWTERPAGPDSAVRRADAGPGETTSIPAAEMARKGSGRPARVLVTEDNENSAILLSDFLSARGYDVRVARSAFEALRLVSEWIPGLILMDIQMPGMDGLEAIRRIRARETADRTPILAVTALAMPGDRQRCISAGADDYMTKPLDFGLLLRTMESHLESVDVGVPGESRP